MFNVLCNYDERQLYPFEQGVGGVDFVSVWGTADLPYTSLLCLCFRGDEIEMVMMPRAVVLWRRAREGKVGRVAVVAEIEL